MTAIAEPTRPDPDALLAQAVAEGRGRLKVFLGAAPGVGKTFEMLAEARRLHASGTDVLIGLLETHGRAETIAAAHGLPLLPRRTLDYRGQTLEEFDLSAALARRPAVLLVDELAHTNAPGSLHPKRWQDIEELRDAGIEVWTTMNVQHLESLSDTVARITGVRVAETVPDRVLAGATSVELVDIPPHELLERMRGGKIYGAAQAERALRGFFKEGSLAALRELALRRTADRVDADVTGWMRANAVTGIWPVGDRVVALLPADAGAEAVLHQARRIADALRAPLLALHVERPGGADPDAALRLAERLGADVEVLPAADIPTAVLAFARARNATHLVVGRGRPALWRRLLGRTLIAALTRRATEFTLHVVPSPAGPPRPAPTNDALPRWIGIAAVPAFVVAAAALCDALDGRIPEGAMGMVFLAAVVALGAGFGPLHAWAGAALGFAAWNFLFLPPRYTFAIAAAQDIVGGIVFVVVALLLGAATGGLGTRERAARVRLAALRRLAGLARRLNAPGNTADLLQAVAEEASRAADCPACVLLPLDDTLPEGIGAAAPGAPPELVVRAAQPADAAPDDVSMAAASWAIAAGRPAGRDTETLPTAAWTFRPLRGATEGPPLGLLALRPAGALGSETDRVLDTLLDQAAVALERARLAETTARDRARAETEGLRTALLTSLGHDLRTPLTAIRGAAETLRTGGDALPAATRIDLLASIEEEATRLARWLSAILDLVRLESGQLAPRLEPLDLADAVATAADRAERAHPGRPVVRDMPATLPRPRLDAALFDRVLENLLDNAFKFSAPAGRVAVAARREGADLVITVEDDGPGIPPGDLSRVFDPFFRARLTDRVAAGTGLGLAICRGLVSAMGGRIAAESPVRDGSGTRITLRFPA